MREAPSTGTKSQFMAAYRRILQEKYEWAQNEKALDRYMNSVRMTLAGEANSWSRSGDAYFAALREVGINQRITLKAFRELPNE